MNFSIKSSISLNEFNKRSKSFLIGKDFYAVCLFQGKYSLVWPFKNAARTRTCF